MKKKKNKKKIKFELSSGAIIFHQNHKRKYLLLQYETKDRYWGFPKGQVEIKNKESVQEAAFREIKEETGLDKNEIEVVPGFREKIHYFFKEGKKLVSKDVIYFLIRAKKTQIKLSKEHINFSWLEFDKAYKILKHKNHKELLSKAENYLKNLNYANSNLSYN